ncbi:GNAT family N-acetyltransferase [Alkalihalobacillus sp. LMS6]|uniref:GNAT family N-acetyltransferase n=1 Tax=Alkalihalobacillus sp. LMS6 TaxID=2924034 RepID=UPI0020D16301|nr:GNAT family N-acetyltransferase [Alkalihalobacillus sp. LMS6]UTR06943.1 GNAT family N-acetyltransferase [Alkalihalobacillus sp. LMS6]
MIDVQKADDAHIPGIIYVCRAGYRDVSKCILSESYIEKQCETYYNPDRIAKEVGEPTHSWGGYFVALDHGQVVGAAGGGMTKKGTGWLYVIYLDPQRRNEGIGTKLLDAVTQQQKAFGAREQFVTVQRGNVKGIPFYEARGFIFQEEIVSNNLDEEPGAVVYKFRRSI